MRFLPRKQRGEARATLPAAWVSEARRGRASLSPGGCGSPCLGCRYRLLSLETLRCGAVPCCWGEFAFPRFMARGAFRARSKKGKLRSFLLGLAFAFGWTPCAGPALVAMLMLASTQATVTRGTALLTVYPAGLAVPFLLVALGTSRFVSLYQRWRSRLVWVERFAGVMLIGVGVLVFFDLFQELSNHLSFFTRFAL